MGGRLVRSGHCPRLSSSLLRDSCTHGRKTPFKHDLHICTARLLPTHARMRSCVHACVRIGWQHAHVIAHCTRVHASCTHACMHARTTLDVVVHTCTPGMHAYLPTCWYAHLLAGMYPERSCTRARMHVHTGRLHIAPRRRVQSAHLFMHSVGHNPCTHACARSPLYACTHAFMHARLILRHSIAHACS